RHASTAVWNRRIGSGMPIQRSSAKNSSTAAATSATVTAVPCHRYRARSRRSWAASSARSVAPMSARGAPESVGWVTNARARSPLEDRQVLQRDLQDQRRDRRAERVARPGVADPAAVAALRVQQDRLHALEVARPLRVAGDVVGLHRIVVAVEEEVVALGVRGEAPQVAV